LGNWLKRISWRGQRTSVHSQSGINVLRRDSLQIAELCGPLDPLMNHLPDSADGHTITVRELFEGPSLYEVERYNAPLNIRAVLPWKCRNLRRKADVAIPDCRSDAGETITCYAAFRTGGRPACHS
jgi:hypothetical protein